MRHLFQLSFSLVLAVILLSCSGENHSTPAYNPGLGPFDEDGNYVEAWADNPPTRSWVSRTPQPPKEPESTVVRRSPAQPSVIPPHPRPVAQVTPPRPVAKPKPVAKPTPKPAPKPKPPAARSHVVVKGDTLYNLSQRYKTTVSAIQKANRISGTTIRLGQRLKIP